MKNETGPQVVDWDLRSAKTTRQLGGRSTMLASVEARNDTLIRVHIMLPDGVEISGEYDSVNAAPGGSPLIGEEAPVGSIQLSDANVDSIGALTNLADRFKTTFGMSVSEAARLDAFLARSGQFIESDSGVIKQSSWGNEVAAGFQGLPKGSVRPGFTIRVLDGEFSTYTAIEFASPGA